MCCLSINYVFCNVLDESKNSLYLLCVYGTPYLVERESVWRTLRSIIWSHPWRLVTIDDFNQIEFSCQKHGGNSVIPGAHIFSQWKLEFGLHEIPFHGSAFTWCNNREGEGIIYERLDRAYCSDDWRTLFPDGLMWNLPIVISDHSPIILDCNPCHDKKKRPY